MRVIDVIGKTQIDLKGESRNPIFGTQSGKFYSRCVTFGVLSNIVRQSYVVSIEIGRASCRERV